MSDPQRSEPPAGDEDAHRDKPVSSSEGETGAEAAQAAPASAAEAPTAEAHSTEGGSTEGGSTEAQSTDTRDSEPTPADGEQAEAAQPAAGTADTEQAEQAQPGTDNAEAPAILAARRKGRRQGLLLGVGISVLVVIVALGVSALVWPGFLTGPGKPDGKASEATAALASKNSGQVDKVSCHGPDGKSTAQIPPQAMQMIASVKPAGPAQQLLDTEATAPINLTLSAQGQTQDVPAEVVLGVTKGEWCMKGISQRQ
jgi:hypothetical protein